MQGRIRGQIHTYFNTAAEGRSVREELLRTQVNDQVTTLNSTHFFHPCACVQAQHVLSEAKTRLEGSMLEGSTSDVVKGVTYIQARTSSRKSIICIIHVISHIVFYRIFQLRPSYDTGMLESSPSPCVFRPDCLEMPHLAMLECVGPTS